MIWLSYGQECGKIVWQYVVRSVANVWQMIRKLWSRAWQSYGEEYGKIVWQHVGRNVAKSYGSMWSGVWQMAWKYRLSKDKET
jgi:hypothetical protein